MSGLFKHSDSQFIRKLTASQPQLFGYIMSSVGRQADAHDVLQETNVRLWEKRKQYDPELSFSTWAIGAARFQILAYYRDKQREKLVFDEDVLEAVQKSAETKVHQLSTRQEALNRCLCQLREEHQTFLSLRYAHNKSLAHISELSGRSVSALKSLFCRLRGTLGKCIVETLQDDPST